MRTFIKDGNTFKYQIKTYGDLINIQVFSNIREELELIDEITINKDELNEDC